MYNIDKKDKNENTRKYNQINNYILSWSDNKVDEELKITQRKILKTTLRPINVAKNEYRTKKKLINIK